MTQRSPLTAVAWSECISKFAAAGNPFLTPMVMPDNEGLNGG
jgi:hypothetical protein